MQSNDRLQQLVALQTEVSLERQKNAQDSDRLAFLESDSLRLHSELKQQGGMITRLTGEIEEKKQQISNLEAQVACYHADNLVQTDHTNALNKIIEQQAGEICRLEEKIKEHELHQQLQENQLRVMKEEKQMEHARVEELNSCVQSGAQEISRLQRAVEEENEVIRTANEREKQLRQEIQAFVRFNTNTSSPFLLQLTSLIFRENPFQHWNR